MGLFDFMRKDKEEDHKTATVNTVVIQEEARGTSGTEIYAGYYDEEYLDDLKGTERAKVFDKMWRSDTQVKMLVSAVTNPISSAQTEINAASSDDPEYEKHAALCRKVFFEDLNTKHLIKMALRFVRDGYSIFEKVHKVNMQGKVTDDDGNVLMDAYIGLAKLAWRSPKTIETWNFDTEKNLRSVSQQAYGDIESYVDIPVEHLVIMTLDGDGDNYEGVSMLRPCYGNYYRKNVYQKLNAIGIEKSMPIPLATAPTGSEGSSDFGNMKTVLEKFTSHQANYIIKPTGWEVELSAGTNYDPEKVESSIDNEDKRMAKAFLANFLELGTGGNGGAYALSNDLSDFFLGGLVQMSDIIKEAFEEVMKELVIINFGEQEKYPTFEFIGIQDKAGKEFAEIIKLLVESKVIIPDDDLEDHLRNRFSVPERSEEGQREFNQPQPAQMSEERQVMLAIDKRRQQLSEAC
jgi:hypothetical protein